MFRLEKLSSLVKKRKRVGRGGKRGGTSGKGHKGQKARTSGTVRLGFEGGQMPLYRRLPKRGFNNEKFKHEVIAINIDLLNERFNDGDVISKEILREKKIIKPSKGQLFLLKVLGNGTLSKKLTVKTNLISESAKKAIEAKGGEVQLLQEM